MVKASNLLSGALLIGSVYGHSYWQSLFKSNGISWNFLEPSSNDEFHYSQLDSEEWPINVAQYTDMVVRLNYSKNSELRKFLLLNKHSKGPQEQLEVDNISYKVWAKSETNQYIDLQIDEENLFKIVERFSTREYKLEYLVIIEDLAQKVFESYPNGYKSGSHLEKFGTSTASSYIKEVTDEVVQATEANVFSELFFKDYRPLETIDAWLDILVQTFPDLLTIEEIGQTYEHRTYKTVHLSAKNDDDNSHKEKKTIVITGGVHAREWISVSSVCYTIYGMLQYYMEHPDERDILDQLDFLFIPVLNPDGYVYTWTTDRLWRKNRQETTFPKCFGIDIDHSYDYHWTRSLDWACGEDYSGEVPFEAIESRIWNDYLNATNHNLNMYGYIDLHSYSQEVLYPYAYSCSQQPRDEENLIELAYGISKAIRLQSGKNYQVLPACIDKDLDLLPDLGSGSALDFMYHNKAFWAYQLKLRDSGSHGFLLPGKYVEPVGKEILAGIRYFCSFILKED